MRYSILASLPLVALLAACAPTDGYYDAYGNYVPYNTTTEAQRRHAPDPGRSYGEPRTGYAKPVVAVPVDRDYPYDRAGYYDYNGYYVTVDDRVNVPEHMLPPRGMCRVWLPNRRVSEQPGIESCHGVQSRVPAGAYVIYGG